jgi:hypothetical protein
MECLGIRGALPSGRTECVPPRKPAPALSQGFPRKAILPWMALPAEGRASHARKERHRLDPGHVPPRPPGRRLSLGHHDIPRACVRPVFTGAETAPLRGNHPSAISGLSPIRPSCPGRPSPRRGGLRTPANGTLLVSGDCSIRPPGVHLPPVIMICLGLRPACIHGRGDRAPPRKSPFASSPGFPPQGHPYWASAQAEGRAPHARKVGLRLTEACAR